MRFVDYVTITVRSGKGGAGATAFRREKFVPRGGPAGGDGGRGASVILEADAQINTLLDLRYQRHHYAQIGGPGGGNNRSGKDGDDLVLRVPLGTSARLVEGGDLLGEVGAAGERLVLARGGRGGRGNAFFKSSTNQTPRYSQPGEPGEEFKVALELRLLADVGLVGLPNAGKSTLVSSISAAKPKVGDYPFTTLVPTPGVVYVEDYSSFVIADIPGIIEGAHLGKGLGLRFLKHIERNSVLLFLVPVTSEDPKQEYEVLLEELETYNPEILTKPRYVAFSKADLLPADEREDWLALHCDQVDGVEGVELISAVSGYNLPTLKTALWSLVEIQRQHSTNNAGRTAIRES